LISVIVVVLVAIGIYIAAEALGGTKPHGETPEDESAAARELFFKAVQKPIGAGDYTYSYEEVQNSGYRTEVTISRNGGESYAMRRDAVSERYAYFGGDGTVVCIKHGGEEECSEVGNESIFAGYSLSLKNLLHDGDGSTVMKIHYQRLLEYGGMQFGASTTEKVVEGHACREVSYSVDYSRLTVAQLNEIGLSANDPLLLRSREYRFTMCIAPDGEIWHKTVRWTDLGKEAWIESTTTEATWGRGMDISRPTELSTDAELHALYNKVAELAGEYLTCLAGEGKERCIANLAIAHRNIGLCAEAGEHMDFCYINAGLQSRDPSACEKASAGMRDTCYIEFANLMKDRSFCGMIGDAEIKAQCEALNISSAGGGECRVDADCARAGCSSQLCVPAASAGDVVTTCEYLPEYACLAHTSCGCVDGACSWRQTPDYLNCLSVTRG